MKFILCQPAIKRFEWELEVCLTRLKKLGISDIVLLFAQQDDRVPAYLEEKYEAEVHVYADRRENKTYIPSIKPYLWMQYLKEDRSREKDSYFYLDSDVILRDIPNVKPNKKKWIASACESYLGIDYIDNKGEDLLDRMCEEIGIDPNLIRRNNPFGGAQWAIKHPTFDYWKKVYHDSNKLYSFLSKVEPEYMKGQHSRYTPIQKWTAEMWAQLWNVYHFGIDVETPEEMNFCWPTDNKEAYEKTKVFHNAGVINDHQGLFYKGKYVNRAPFDDLPIKVNPAKASIEYVKAIEEVKKEEINMAKYEVVAGFRDKEDDKEYFEGDHYPKPANKKVTQKRIKELSSKNNNAGKPLIQKIEE